MLLVRATTLTKAAISLADEMKAISGQDIGFVLDGRHPVAISTPYPSVMLTEAACSDLGLYCPYDFPWRCGDYGLYLARRQFPTETHFWLLDHDIWITGTRPAAFFECFADKPHDLLAPNYRRPRKDWDWYYHARGRDVVTYECLFSIIRLSARALDRLLQKRVQQGRISHRRKMYPNDEGFVATTLSNENFSCADFNDFGQTFHDDTTVSVFMPLRGETLPATGNNIRIYHPVLWGSDYERGNVCVGPKRKYGLVTTAKINLRKRLSTITAW